MKNSLEKQNHSIGPFIKKDSKILILGSFPSVKSREMNFYYGHKQNRFWRVISNLFFEDEPITIKDKEEFLIRNKIAIYDVIKECEIVGSSDSSIKNIVPSRIKELIKNTDVKTIVVNGATAAKYFKKYNADLMKEVNVHFLPSTSPANAKFRIDDLIKSWKIILD